MYSVARISLTGKLKYVAFKSLARTCHMAYFNEYGKIKSFPVSGRQGTYSVNSTSDYLLYSLIFNIFIISKEEINNEGKILVIIFFLYIIIIFIYIKMFYYFFLVSCGCRKMYGYNNNGILMILFWNLYCW